MLWPYVQYGLTMATISIAVRIRTGPSCLHAGKMAPNLPRCAARLVPGSALFCLVCSPLLLCMQPSFAMYTGFFGLAVP